MPAHIRPYESPFQGPPVPQKTPEARKEHSVTLFPLPECICTLKAGTALLLTVLLTLWALKAFGADLNILKGEGVEVLFPPSLEPVAQETAQMTPKIKKIFRKYYSGRSRLRLPLFSWKTVGFSVK